MEEQQKNLQTPPKPLTGTSEQPHKTEVKPPFNKPQHITPTVPTLTYISLGGVGEVTRNMHVYEYGDEMLIVDCGLGFADETMLGVDLLLPDISYLLKSKKKIVGIAITHGHEDHIGALPFLLPQLPPNIPVYATPLTAAFINEKFREFNIKQTVNTVEFDKPDVKLGVFGLTFIRVTHSVPDSSNIFIRTPVGNFYHTGDFKFDLTPADKNRSDFHKITEVAREGVMCLMSDCLGSEKAGHTPTELGMEENFIHAMQKCKGKVFMTTYSSNIARLNQAIVAAQAVGRRVCFVGRSLIKSKTIAEKLGLLQLQDGVEVDLENLKKIDEDKIVILVTGNQGQENSAMYRIASGEHKDIKLTPDDIIIFSSDIIPGNEISVNSLIDLIGRRGATPLYSPITHGFHVSGHGMADDLKLMMSLTKPKHVLPVSGTYKHMIAYRTLARDMGYKTADILLAESGQKVLFSKTGVKLGERIEIRNVYVDQVSGEEVESFVLRDREKLAKDGIVVLMVEIQAANGQIADMIDIIARGFLPTEAETLKRTLAGVIKDALKKKSGRVTNWIQIRKEMGDLAGKHIFHKLRRRPLILPVVIEV